MDVQNKRRFCHPARQLCLSVFAFVKKSNFQKILYVFFHIAVDLCVIGVAPNNARKRGHCTLVSVRSAKSIKYGFAFFVCYKPNEIGRIKKEIF
jgi:hypothetical protein